MPINSTIEEVKEVMSNLEINMFELLKERSSLLNDNKSKFQMIESDQTFFVSDQQKKIN